MRIVFMGTPRFAVPSLSKLLSDGHEMAAVVTQLDKVSGRGRQLTPPPVKILAQEKRLKIFQPDDVNEQGFLHVLAASKPELVVVVAYGAILGKELLELPSAGCINLHASLLPKLRGAAPVNWAIIRGERATGVTTVWMSEKVDAGEIILQRYVPIFPEETAGELEKRLSVIGSELLSVTLRAVSEGCAPRIPQNQSLSSYAPKLKKEHGIIDLRLDAETVCDHIRGVTPWPGAQTSLRGEQLKILKSKVLELASTYEPGSVLSIEESDGIAVAAGRGVLLVVEVQPSGKKPMSAIDFARGRRLSVGERFGT